VTIAAKKVITNTKSIAMSLDTCTVPGSVKEDRIPQGMAELGLGIHGEAGVEQIPFSNAKGALGAVVSKLKTVVENKQHVALVNNLGGASVLEMSVVLNELILSEFGDQIRYVIGPAAMMTSLDMQGFSISLYPADSKEIELLAAENSVPAWPGLSSIRPITKQALPDELTPITPLASKHAATSEFLMNCCNLLISAEDDLNLLDAKSGDGDTGATLARGAKSLIDAIDRLPLADHTQLCRAIGLELSQTMGGSSGVLLAIFFTAASDAASGGLSIRDAFKAGLTRMQEIGGAQPGDRTMVDALAPALDALEKGIAAAALAARAGADHTATIVKARAGRAAYVNASHLQGHNDPGAEAVARLFENLAG